MPCIFICRIFLSLYLGREDIWWIQNLVLALHHREMDMTSFYYFGGVLLSGIRVFPDDSFIFKKWKRRNDLKFFLFYLGELS